MSKLSELSYDEWPMIYSALRKQQEFHWDQVERFGKEDGDMELYSYHNYKAQEYEFLKNKIYRLANEQFPIVEDEKPQEIKVI